MKSMQVSEKRAIILVQTGSPAQPFSRYVRPYLREFLSDGRVIDIPAPLRYILVNGIIVPFRTKKSTSMYRRIWTEYGSPLIYNTKVIRDKLQHRLDDKFPEKYQVLAAMRYGQPSIKRVFLELRKKNFNSIIVLPLFPQYASATVGSIYAKIFSVAQKEENIPAFKFVPPFYRDPRYIDALSRQIQNHFKRANKEIKNYFFLFSFHGLPESQIKKSDTSRSHCLQKEDCCANYLNHNPYCYRAQCLKNAELVADKLKLKKDSWTASFQSRLGRGEWLKPYTSDVVTELAQAGQETAIISPSFIADNLETLDELNHEERRSYYKKGGSDFQWIPSLNGDDKWMDSLAEIILD